MLAVVQMILALGLLTGGHGPEAQAKTVAAAPGGAVPAQMPNRITVTPSVVPEIGQIATPPRASAPPLPGSLVPAPAAPVSNGPPPIGSFTQPGAGGPQTAPPAPPAYAPLTAPGSGVRGAPVLPPAADAQKSARPPLPGSSAPVPAMPALPGSSAPVPAMPALPGASAPMPALPPGYGPGGVKEDAATRAMRDVNFVLNTAKELRGMSDMQGTLDLLRRANELTPDHPAIMAEIAQTYEQMGLTAKAMDAWRSIQLLGATKAGSYFELANRRLGSGSAGVTAPALPGAPGADSEKFVRLGACQVTRDTTVSSGERYVLRVPIVRAGNRPINRNELDLNVYFFDRVNHEKVAQTIAPEPAVSWQSSPVDWKGTGEEVVDVIYHLPALSAAEIQQHGHRSYFGYMLQLYYNNKLQDVAAEPRDLLEFGSAPGTGPAGANPLLPPMGK